MSEILWVAELGSNHQGSKALCYELIRKAVWAGSNLIKLQLGCTREAQAKYASSYDERRYIDDWAQDIDAWCKSFGVEWFASIWSLAGLEVARSVGMKRYKIAHQMDDRELIDAILSDGKHVFWSNHVMLGRKNTTGVLTTEEYPTYKLPDDLANYNPEYPIEAYSSHMHGIADALMAVTMGAEYVEKHLTLYNYAGFPRDAAFSLLPDEFRQMVDVGNEIARLR